MSNTEFLLDNRLWLPADSVEAKRALFELQYRTSVNGKQNAGQVIRLYEESGDYLVVPRHYLDGFGYRTRYVGPWDFPILDEKCDIQPRDQLQADALQFLGQYGASPADSDAIVSLRCGEGKTLLGLKGAFDYGYWTLVIAHTEDILKNWKKEILAHTTLTNVGSIVSGSYDIQPVTLALIQSLLALPPEKLEMLTRLFGCVIVDEMHHLAAPIFSAIGNLFPGRRIGLSATLAREDGLSFVYYYAFGKRVFWRQSLREKAKVAMKRIKVTDVEFKENYALSVSELVNSSQYLSAIETDVRDGYRKQQKQLIIANRKELLWTLEKRLEDLDPGCNTRETPSDERAANLATKPVVLCIDHFGKEGLNEPTLTNLRVITPMKDRNAITQTVGRLERESEGKGAIEAVFYAPMYAPFLSTLQKAREALVREGYRVYDW